MERFLIIPEKGVMMIQREELKLGAQLYTAREYMKTKEQFAAAMMRISAIGYKYAQVSGAADAPWEVIKKASQDSGVEVVLTHVEPERLFSQLDAIIEEHKQFGAKAVGLTQMPKQYPRTAEGFKRFCSDISPVAEKLGENGLVFAYHNHVFEFEKFDNITGIDILLSQTPQDSFKLTFDVFWAQTAGVDPASFISRYAQRIFCTHLRDMTVIDGVPNECEVLEGNMNFSSIIDASLKNGVEYHFAEQDVVRISAFDSLRRSYENLTENLFCK